MSNPKGNEELRQELRSQCQRSLYFFAKAVLGYKDMTAELHLDVCRFLQGPSRQKLLELPRQHLKSTIGTMSYAIWRIIKDPNIRILIVSATSTNASKFLRDIMSHFETNEILRWLFPEVIPDFKKVKWTETAIEVQRSQHFPEATVEAIGVGGTAVSRHYNLKIMDDLVNEDHLIDTEQMNKVVEWYKRSVNLGINPNTDEDLVIGNRWAFNDIISFVKENQPYFQVYSRAAIEDELCIWPERFNQEVLDRILELQGPKIFSCQFMNNPVHEDSRSFDPSWFRRFDDLPTQNLRFYTAIDPAISTKRGDYSALVTVGMDGLRNIYIVDVRRGRWGVDELIDQMFDVVRTWRPIEVGLETVMFQKALLWPIREAMRRHETTFRIKELRPSTKITKEGRISALHEYFANGSLWIRKGLRELEQELLQFPVGAHDDMIDALAYVVQMAKPAQREERIVNPDPFTLEEMINELDKRRHESSSKVFTMHEPYKIDAKGDFIHATS